MIKISSSIRIAFFKRLEKQLIILYLSEHI